VLVSESFVEGAEGSLFPLQNLPYGVFQPRTGEVWRVGVAIGDCVLDVAALDDCGLLAGTGAEGRQVFAADTLNAFMAMGRPTWRAVRARLQQLLASDEPILRDNAALRAAALFARADVRLKLPARIGDYTDFYAAKDHAANVGAMFRGKDNALMPNWVHLPVGYHGRSSSIVVSGTDVRRPLGQMRLAGAERPRFGPSQQLDFELELGLFMGPGNALGDPIPVDEAEEHIFGVVLVNDWSARDIQSWEYVPLGPFLAKNFATSISPWVVPLDALEPFRTAGPPQDPEPLPYLRQARPGAFDVRLQVHLQGADMRAPQCLCESNARFLYWSAAQQVAHHTVGGCNLRPGDLLASGTISGPEKTQRGCLLELTWRGEEPVPLAGGGTRVFLEDGDEVTMSGWCQGDGYRIGLGDVRGRVLPARS
jgi:fumarylacetoacetase